MSHFFLSPDRPRSNRLAWPLSVLLAAWVAVSHVAPFDGSIASAQQPASVPPFASMPSATLSDEQILGIAMTANSSEVDEGQLALTKASRADVRAFAQEMVTDHSAANARLDALSKAAGILPQPSPQQQAIKDENTATLADLQGRSGADFDQAYVASQVKGHERLLNLFDSELIPSATNPDLRTELVNERATVARHLAIAQALAEEPAEAPAAAQP